MANRTDPAAKSIRGTNPQNLVEFILRTKIYETTYWKQQCFGLTAETLVDKAMELDHIGGTHGGTGRPTPFICLVLKMLQIQPEKDIVVEFIKNDDYKYVRALGAFYLRLTGTDIDVYRYLEPLYNDYRKLRMQSAEGKLVLSHVDEVIDELLTKDYACDIALPRVNKRWTLESRGLLEPWKSVLEDDFEEEEEKEGEMEQLDGVEKGVNDEKDYYNGRSPTRERDRDRRRDGRRHRDRDYDRDYDRDRDRERDRDRYRLRDVRDHGRGREREGRDRERRDRDRGGGGGSRRSPSRSRSRSRDHRKRRCSDGGGADETKKKKKKSEKKDDGTDHLDPEIAEANKIRASLGLKPLK